LRRRAYASGLIADLRLTLETGAGRPFPFDACDKVTLQIEGIAYVTVKKPVPRNFDGLLRDVDNGRNV
jgi:hypothetical protein